MCKYFLSLLFVCCFFPMLARADITIGVGGPLTGSIAAQGNYMKAGAQLAIDDINKAGGVLGQKLVMDAQDDACEPKQAVSVANRFVNEHAALVIGHICSGSSMPASDVYAENNTVQIDPFAMLEEITKRGHQTIFRVSGTTGAFGEAMAAFAHNNIKPRRVAVLTEKRAITQELSQHIMTHLRKDGLTDITELVYTPGEKDYSATISRLKELAPDVVFCSCYTTEGGLLVRQVRIAGMATPVIGYSTIGADDFINIVGSSEQNVYVVNYTANGNGAKELHTYLKAHKLGYDSALTQAYAAVQVFAQAVAKTGKLDGVALAKTLKSQSFDTIIGPVAFDKNGDVVDAHLATYRWQNGQPALVK